MRIQPNLYALLVGIDKYASPRICTLGGCVVNDVNALLNRKEEHHVNPPIYS